jgi:hypothetical protein
LVRLKEKSERCLVRLGVKFKNGQALVILRVACNVDTQSTS